MDTSETLTHGLMNIFIHCAWTTRSLWDFTHIHCSMRDGGEKYAVLDCFVRSYFLTHSSQCFPVVIINVVLHLRVANRAVAENYCRQLVQRGGLNIYKPLDTQSRGSFSLRVMRSRTDCGAIILGGFFLFWYRRPVFQFLTSFLIKNTLIFFAT